MYLLILLFFFWNKHILVDINENKNVGKIKFEEFPGNKKVKEIVKENSNEKKEIKGTVHFLYHKKLAKISKSVK